jgi:hypothetical protein
MLDDALQRLSRQIRKFEESADMNEPVVKTIPVRDSEHSSDILICLYAMILFE